MIHISRKVILPNEMTLSCIRHIAKSSLSTTQTDGDVSIIFTNNTEIHNLNRDFRDVDAPTDVLSFPSDEVDPDSGIRYLGDIVISVEKAATQAKIAGKPLFDEISMLIVHGCLHLAGFDHSSDEQRDEMKKLQESILANLGIKNYSWPEEI